MSATSCPGSDTLSTASLRVLEIEFLIRLKMPGFLLLIERLVLRGGGLAARGW